MKRILFYSPFGSRTGSDMMLSYIIRHLDKSRFAPVVFSEKKWPLMHEYEETGWVYHSGLESSRVKRLLEVTGKKIFDVSLYENQLLQIIKRYQPDLIYLNTIVAHKIIPVLKRVNIPFITHCHELVYSYQGIAAADLDFLVKESKLMIGCSKEVCSQLRMLGAQKVAQVYEAIDTSRIPTALNRNNELREKWNIAPDAKVWMMAGLRHYRKGFDLIPEIAGLIKSHGGWMVWAGKSFHSGYDTLVQAKIATEHLDNVVLIDEQDEDYFPLLQMAEGLALTSREDPFPLVMLEASWLGKPVVAFDSGGVREYIEAGMGHIVDRYDTRLFSMAINDYILGQFKADPALSRRRASGFTIESIMKQWHELIEATID